MGTTEPEDAEERLPAGPPSFEVPPRRVAALLALSAFVRDLEDRNPFAVAEGSPKDAEPYRLSARLAAAANGEIDVDSVLGELREPRLRPVRPRPRASR